MSSHITTPDRVKRIIEKVAGRHGFMPDEIIGHDASADARAARAEIVTALAPIYTKREIATFLGRPTSAAMPLAKVAVIAVAPERPGTVLSLWRGVIFLAKQKRPLDEIAEDVACLYGVSVETLRGAARDQANTVPRQHAMAAMIEAGWSYPKVGRYLGNRDHTTVLHGVKRHNARIAAEWSGRAAA